MKKFLGGVLAAAALAASPASAMSFVDAGDSVVINYNGIVDGDVVNGLTSSLTLTFLGFTGNNANFSYQLSNTSSGAITASRLSSFGFDVETANFSFANSSETSSIFTKRNSGQFPQPNDGGGPRDFCMSAGPNCGGGGGGGVLIGNSESAGFTLAFTSLPSMVELSNFAVRYQSITGAQGGNSGIGVGTPSVDAVPEPATWAMMIGGFGLVGGALRRRRSLASVSA
jgi:hypothetical protein